MAGKEEMRITQKQHLISLLTIKKDSSRLDEELTRVIGAMDESDVAYVEKIIGISAID